MTILSSMTGINCTRSLGHNTIPYDRVRFWRTLVCCHKIRVTLFLEVDKLNKNVFRQITFVVSVQNVYSSILVPTKTPELEKCSDSRASDVSLDDPPTQSWWKHKHFCFLQYWKWHKTLWCGWVIKGQVRSSKIWKFLQLRCFRRYQDWRVVHVLYRKHKRALAEHIFILFIHFEKQK